MGEEFNYERREITRALDSTPDGQNLTMKIDGGAKSTRWLVVSPQQVRAIQEILAGDDIVTVIDAGSEAFEELRRSLADSSTRKVSLSIRSDGLAIKTNEYMWTPGLAIKKV